MWTIELVELGCAWPECEKLAQTLLKQSNGQGYFLQEVYCRKHGQAKRKAITEEYAKSEIAFMDRT
jgi:hypothetical protein